MSQIFRENLFFVKILILIFFVCLFVCLCGAKLIWKFSFCHKFGLKIWVLFFAKLIRQLDLCRRFDFKKYPFCRRANLHILFLSCNLTWRYDFCSKIDLRFWFFSQIRPEDLIFAAKLIWQFAFCCKFNFVVELIFKILFLSEIDLTIFFFFFFYSQNLIENLFFVAKLSWEFVYRHKFDLKIWLVCVVELICKFAFCLKFDLKIWFLSQNWFENFYFITNLIFFKKICYFSESWFQNFPFVTNLTRKVVFCCKFDFNKSIFCRRADF